MDFEVGGIAVVSADNIPEGHIGSAFPIVCVVPKYIIITVSDVVDSIMTLTEKEANIFNLDGYLSWLYTGRKIWTLKQKNIIKMFPRPKRGDLITIRNDADTCDETWPLLGMHTENMRGYTGLILEANRDVSGACRIRDEQTVELKLPATDENKYAIRKGLSHIIKIESQQNQIVKPKYLQDISDQGRFLSGIDEYRQSNHKRGNSGLEFL